MNKQILFIFLLICSTTLRAQVDYTGNYSFQNKVYFDNNSEIKPNKKEINQGRIGDLTLFRVSKNKYKFWLSANRGWPSYNHGAINGFIEIQNNWAAFSEKNEFADSSCKIFYKFSKNSIDVTQNASSNDCGFGHNVYADGVYKKRDSKKVTNSFLSEFYFDAENIKIISDKANLYLEPDTSKGINRYFIKGDIVLKIGENDSFIYTEYITASGKFIFGWILKSQIKETSK